MVCYSNEMKAKAQRFVMMVSVALFVMGLLTVAYAYTQSTGKTVDTEYTKFKVDKSGFAYLTLVGGIFSIVTAILGCLTAKFKNPLLALPFGICAGVMGLILLIAGAIAAGFDGKIEELRVQACTTPVEQYGGLTGEVFIGSQYGDLIDDVMCSQVCQCEEGASQANTKLWDGYGTAYLAKYNRSISTVASTTSVTALSFKAGGLTNYKACYDTVLKAKFKATEDKGDSQTAKEKDQTKKVKEFFEKGGYEFLAQLETDYECASMCKVPLFYISRDIKLGKPTMECTEAIVEAVTGKILVAVVCFITALVLICADRKSVV